MAPLPRTLRAHRLGSPTCGTAPADLPPAPQAAMVPLWPSPISIVLFWLPVSASEPMNLFISIIDISQDLFLISDDTPPPVRDRELVTEAIRKAGGQKLLAASLVWHNGSQRVGPARGQSTSCKTKARGIPPKPRSTDLEGNRKPTYRRRVKEAFAVIVGLLRVVGLTLKSENHRRSATPGSQALRRSAHECLRGFDANSRNINECWRTEHQGKLGSRRKRRNNPNHE